MKQNASQYIESYFVSKVAFRPLETQVMLSIRNTVSEYLEFCHTHTRARVSRTRPPQCSLYVPPVVTICTASITFNNSTFCPHSVFMCFVWISEQAANISLYSINWLVYITETECVYCVVRTACLNADAETRSYNVKKSEFCKMFIASRSVSWCYKLL